MSSIDSRSCGSSFYCATANGNIVIRQYIRVRCSNYYGGTSFIAKFYLLRNSPHRFIMSRGMFWRLGYKIMRPDGEFVVQSQNEEMLPDLYDNLYKALDYPVAGETLLVDPRECRDPTEFLYHVARVHERWHRQDLLESVAMPPTWAIVRGNHVLHATGSLWHMRQSAAAAREALPELTIPPSRERVGLSREQILKEAKLAHGPISSPKLRQEFYDLLVEDEKRYAAHMADVGVIPGVGSSVWRLGPGYRLYR